MSKSSIGTEPVYDARTLGKPRMFILGLQHMFAMFGATVLVPALSGLDVATTLLFAGLGTLLFHLLTKGKVPAFLGSSFAFIGGYNAVRTIGTNPDGSAIYNNDLLAYACFGVAIAGLMYIILSTLFKVFGVKKVMRYFPPIVTGPIIIAIGLTLSSSAITNCRANWLVAVVAILIVIGFNMWGKGMTKIIPILLGVLGSYIFALIVDPAERASVAAAVSSAKWFGLPIFWKNSVFHLFAGAGRQRRPLVRRADGRAAVPRHHGRAHRRYLRHLLHLRQELHGRPRLPPHPAGRRPGHHPRFPLRRSGQHHLR